MNTMLFLVMASGFASGQDIPKIPDDIRKKCENRLEIMSFYAPDPWGNLTYIGENPKPQAGLFPVIVGSAAFPPPGTPDLGIPFGFRLSLPLFEQFKFESRMVAELKNLRYLELSGYRYELDDFRKLAKHPSLAMLSMETANDDILEVLKEFTGLEYLDFRVSKNLSSKGIRCLAELKKLKWLKLSSDQLNDDDYKMLSTIKTLTHLDVSSGAVTDESIKHFKNLPELAVLNLYGNLKLTTACFKELKEMKKLRSLELPQYIKLDPGLRELKELINLKALKIVFTVKPESIEVLSEFKELEHLNIKVHSLKPEEIDTLKKALPKTKIDH